MARTTTILVIGTALVLAIAIAFGYLAQWEPDAADTGQNQNVEQQPTLSNQADCSAAGPDIAREVEVPYRQLTEATAAGTATVSGRVVTREQTIFGEPVESVYLAVASSSPDTFRSFNVARVEQGNTVNQMSDSTLLFKLGALAGGAYTTTAAVSEAARARIESSRTSGEPVMLRLQLPVYEGTEAPTNFTFACAITAA